MQPLRNFRDVVPVSISSSNSNCSREDFLRGAAGCGVPFSSSRVNLGKSQSPAQRSPAVRCRISTFCPSKTAIEASVRGVITGRALGTGNLLLSLREKRFTTGTHRTLSTLWIMRRTDQTPQIHQRLVKCSWCLARQNQLCEFPQLLLSDFERGSNSSPINREYRRSVFASTIGAR